MPLLSPYLREYITHLLAIFYNIQHGKLLMTYVKFL
jgi:hypothetical protein